MPKSNGASQPFEGFAGFNNPQYTPVPDVLFDQLLPDLSDPELRVLLYIMRRTFGFKRETDNISLSQLVGGITTIDGRVLDRGAGISKSAAAKAVKSLAEKGIILSNRNRSVERGDEPTTYSLRFRDTPVSTRKTRGGSPLNGHPRVHQEDTQETGIQKTDVSLSNIRTARAKKVTDDPEEEGSGANASLSDPTLVHPIRERGTAADAPQKAVKATSGATSPIQDSEPLSAQTAVLEAPTTRSELSESLSEPDGSGFRRLRDQASKIRAELANVTPKTNGSLPSKTAVPPGQQSSLTPLADLLPVQPQSLRGNRDERDLVTAYLQDFRPFLGDEAPLTSSVTRAINIFKTAEIPTERWSDLLYQANAITKENTQKIRKKPGEATSGFAAKNRAPYYFAVLEDLCGLRDQPERALLGTG